MNINTDNKLNGLWLAKTGDSNAWYHIYPFVKSNLTKKLHIVRYSYPQRGIHDNRAEFHIFKSGRGVLKLLSFFKAGFKTLRHHDIDYIVSFNLVPWASIAWLLAKIFNKPIIIGLIGKDFNSHVSMPGFNLYKYIIERTDVITVTGSHMKQYFDNRKFDNVFIYPHCLDESFFEEKGQSEVAECDVISVSELIERKRTTDIIEAVALLKAKGTEVKVHILGTGVEMKKMEMLIAQNNLENEVKLLGYQTNILEHLKGSKIFIQASSKEGLSLSLIEAVGAGLVPITTEAGSEKDILTDGLDALFFGIGDTSKLAEKIEFALDENNYRNLNSNVNKLRNELKIDHAIFETEKIQSFLFQKSGHK